MRKESLKFMRHSKRTKLSTNDINSALRVRNVEVYGYSFLSVDLMILCILFAAIVLHVPRMDNHHSGCMDSPTRLHSNSSTSHPLNSVRYFTWRTKNWNSTISSMLPCQKYPRIFVIPVGLVDWISSLMYNSALARDRRRTTCYPPEPSSHRYIILSLWSRVLICSVPLYLSPTRFSFFLSHSLSL